MLNKILNLIVNMSATLAHKSIIWHIYRIGNAVPVCKTFIRNLMLTLAPFLTIIISMDLFILISRKLCQKRHLDINLLEGVLKLLKEGSTLPAEYRYHPLHGVFEGCRESHILPNWLLVYEYSENDLIIYLTRTGTHSDLFKS